MSIFCTCFYSCQKKIPLNMLLTYIRFDINLLHGQLYVMPSIFALKLPNFLSNDV